MMHPIKGQIWINSNGNNIAPLDCVTCLVSFNNITRALDIFILKEATWPIFKSVKF